jgi:hypothetical protein
VENAVVGQLEDPEPLDSRALQLSPPPEQVQRGKNELIQQS